MALLGLKHKERKAPLEELGAVLFPSVQDAIRAERVLRDAGYEVRMVAPPRELRRGCELAVEIVLVEQVGVRRKLGEKGVPYTRIAPLTAGAREPPDIFEVTDFGDWLMVAVGSMKLTYHKQSGTIVNISGSGCPDIPYLYTMLVDRPLEDVPHPGDIGFSPCAWMLGQALLKALELRKAGDRP